MYPMVAAAGAVLTLLFAERIAQKKGVPAFHMIEFLLWSAVGVLIGSHLLYGLIHGRDLLLVIQNFDQITGPDMFLSCLAAIFGGSVFYGGLLGGMAVGFLFLKRHPSYDRPLFLDISACSIPLFHSAARVGCFLAGCCYGIEWPAGVTFHHSLIPGANGVARFPVQLLEAAFELALFCFLFFLFHHRKQQGRLLELYLILYGIGRFLFEFLRGDDDLRKIFFGLSTSQWIAILTVGAACVLYRQSKKSQKQ
ncbi:prolipoprotein diacylglyceryl transferase [Hominifimenecus sp. rT4P-3]|uniref:prolipoprotein diacylglyceryl transferase n=1 Tax=Hominifimenecus sp. rT4P-3 TaxID=3242979 RepID=UPI003DA27E61